MANKEYFSHDYNTRSDDKVKLLIRKYGMTGYGVFWSLIEDLYNNANALRLDCDGIAYDLHTDSDIIRWIIFESKLFRITNDEAFFSSDTVKERLKLRKTKSIKASESAALRWTKRNAIALPTHSSMVSDSNAIKEKKRKEKEKEKEKAAAKAKKDKESKPLASSDTSTSQKRKRKRKKLASDTPYAGGGDGRPRPATAGTGGTAGTAGTTGGARKAPTRFGRDELKEVSKKEIDDQIRATMARLSGGKSRRQKIRRESRKDKVDRQELINAAETDTKLQLTEFVSVSELASIMSIPVTDVIMTCMNLGVIVSINQRLDAEIIELVAGEFGFEVEFISAEDQVLFEEEEDDNPEDLKPRPPVVAVMGHVDHGKTSLLDFIRSANVVSGEAGGITQHIGAYEMEVKPGKSITFLDTPGHEAFTAMRARGAKVTDIAVIIVAADDNVMPQTREAISHAQAAGVPIVFAINKVDKAGADPERIKQELSRMNLLVEDWGGKIQSADISAKTGLNVENLLEKIILEAEMLDLKANPDRLATGTVIEASLDKGRGYVTKMLVQKGTLSVGDIIAVSYTHLTLPTIYSV